MTHMRSILAAGAVAAAAAATAPLQAAAAGAATGYFNSVLTWSTPVTLQAQSESWQIGSAAAIVLGAVEPGAPTVGGNLLLSGTGVESAAYGSGTANIAVSGGTWSVGGTGSYVRAGEIMTVTALNASGCTPSACGTGTWTITLTGLVQPESLQPLYMYAAGFTGSVTVVNAG